MEAMFIVEALDIIQECNMQCQKGGRCEYNCPDQCKSIFSTMAKYSKNHIQKQIVKKVADYNDIRINQKGETIYKCPKCGYYHLLKFDTYCKHCGQRVEV